jgi:iron complex transport system substrate-binding protein
MRPRPPGLLLVALLAVAPPGRGAEAPPVARRVVSLNPSLTETLVAIGAGRALVGVDEYSARLQPEVRSLPTVGGLFNPSLEAVVALEPDLVVLVPGAQQRDLAHRLETLGVAVLPLPNITLEQVLDSIEMLGKRVGRAAEARAHVARIRAAWREVEREAAGRPRVRTVLVIQRDPLYVVGRGSFIDAMLRAAGGENPAAVFPEPYPRAAVEWLIEAAPQVILDASDDPEPSARHWARWPSLPAVDAGRTVSIPPAVVLPGPHLDRSLRLLADAIHRKPAKPARSEPEASEGREGKPAKPARSEPEASEGREGRPAPTDRSAP